MNSNIFIQSQIELLRQIINTVERLRSYDIQKLTWKENINAWNILECLEHLNLYGDFYLPQMEKNIAESKTERELEFKSGFLGGFFAKSMLSQKQVIKMKTFKNKNPLKETLGFYTIDRFLNQQFKLLDLLNQSNHVSLNKIKIKTTISVFISINLGDAFQFNINHMLRHLQQIERIEKNLNY